MASGLGVFSVLELWYLVGRANVQVKRTVGFHSSQMHHLKVNHTTLVFLHPTY